MHRSVDILTQLHRLETESRENIASHVETGTLKELASTYVASTISGIFSTLSLHEEFNILELRNLSVDETTCFFHKSLLANKPYITICMQILFAKLESLLDVAKLLGGDNVKAVPLLIHYINIVLELRMNLETTLV